MKRLQTTVLLTVAVTLSAASAYAVPVTWTVEQMNTSTTDAIVRKVEPSGLGANLGSSSDATVNGVLFKGASLSGGTTSVTGNGFTITAGASGTANFGVNTTLADARYLPNAPGVRDLIDMGAQAGFNGSNIVVTVGGLTPGIDYLAQFLVDQPGVAQGNILLAGGTPSTSGAYTYGTSNGESILAEFTPDSTSQAFTIFRGSGDRSTLSAIAITAAIPEPSAFMLSAMGLLGIGTLVWRRRRRNR